MSKKPSGTGGGDHNKRSKGKEKVRRDVPEPVEMPGPIILVMLIFLGHIHLYGYMDHF